MLATDMNQPTSNRWWHGREWTLALCLLIAIVNFGVFGGSPAWFGDLVSALQYDRAAIQNGEVWRVFTGNLVHWSPDHFALDVGVFLIVGMLYEPVLRQSWLWLIFGSGFAVGFAVFLLQPNLAIYRGLSGVDSGLFAAALGIECLLARREWRRWLWVGPAVLIFVSKLLYECASGKLFFGTESLGNIGEPVPLAHVAGVFAALGCLILCVLKKGSGFGVQGSRCDGADIALWRW